MDDNLIKQLTDYVHSAEKEKREIKKITSELYPALTIEDAYSVQEQLLNEKLADGYRIVGPKMGMTSEAKMKQMGVNDPIYGYLFDYMIVEEGTSISLSDYIHPKVEPEIGFILKKDLEGPNITMFDVLAATDYVFPAIEIIDSRYRNFDFTLPDVIADNSSAAGAIFGTTLTRPEKIELDVVGATLSINGKLQAIGAGAAVLGHPANSVARLANMLAKKDKKVKAGEPILTGGLTAAVPLSKGDHVSVKCGGLGKVSFYVEG